MAAGVGEVSAAATAEEEEAGILAVAVTLRTSRPSQALRRRHGNLRLRVRQVLAWVSLRRLRQHIKAAVADGDLLPPGTREDTREVLHHLLRIIMGTMVTMGAMATKTATSGGTVERAKCCCFTPIGAEP